MLVIPRRDEPAQALFLSVRQAVGVDATLPSEFVGRTSVHQHAAVCSAATSANPPSTMLEKTMDDGESLVDAGAGVEIQQTAHDAASATVKITFTSR